MLLKNIFRIIKSVYQKRNVPRDWHIAERFGMNRIARKI